MLTIQDVGTEILTDKPRSFYIFTGSEYGIKQKYISHLEHLYGSKLEAPRVMALLESFSMRQLIPLAPAVYVVRYDEEFLSKVDANTASKIRKAKIPGTIICLYDSEKGINKLEKHLEDYTVDISGFSKTFIRKYLRQDFPSVPDRLVDIAAEVALNYNHAINICTQMTYANVEELFKLSDKVLAEMFGRQSVSSDSEVRLGVSSKNFKYLCSVLDSYGEELDKFLYAMLSTLVELEKIAGSKYGSSDIQKYATNWTKQDVYNMFMHTYDEIKKLRTYATDARSSIIYLFGLLQFKNIPAYGGAE